MVGPLHRESVSGQRAGESSKRHHRSPRIGALWIADSGLLEAPPVARGRRARTAPCASANRSEHRVEGLLLQRGKVRLYGSLAVLDRGRRDPFLLGRGRLLEDRQRARK